MTMISPSSNTSNRTTPVSANPGPDGTLLAFRPEARIGEEVVKEAIRTRSGETLLAKLASGAKLTPQALAAVSGAKLVVFALLASAAAARPTADTTNIRSAMELTNQMEEGGLTEDVFRHRNGHPVAFTMRSEGNIEAYLINSGGISLHKAMTPGEYRELNEKAKKFVEENQDKTHKEILEEAREQHGAFFEVLVHSHLPVQGLVAPASSLNNSGMDPDSAKMIDDLLSALGYDVPQTPEGRNEAFRRMYEDLRSGKLKVTDQNRDVIAALIDEATKNGFYDSEFARLLTDLLNSNIPSNRVVRGIRMQTFRDADDTTAAMYTGKAGEEFVFNSSRDLYDKDGRKYAADEDHSVTYGTPLYDASGNLVLRMPSDPSNLMVPRLPRSERPSVESRTEPPREERPSETKPAEPRVEPSVEPRVEPSVENADERPTRKQPLPPEEMPEVVVPAEPVPQNTFNREAALIRAELIFNSSSLSPEEKGREIQRLQNEAIRNEPHNEGIWRRMFSALVNDFLDCLETEEEREAFQSGRLQEGSGPGPQSSEPNPLFFADERGDSAPLSVRSA